MLSYRRGTKYKQQKGTRLKGFGKSLITAALRDCPKSVFLACEHAGEKCNILRKWEELSERDTNEF